MDINALLSGAPSPAPAAEPPPERWCYLVTLRSGAQTVRESKLGPGELLPTIKKAAHEKDWITWWDGDGTRAEQIDDVRWIDGELAESLLRVAVARAGATS